jgi:hypothetical protein
MLRVHLKDPDYEQWEDACHEGERNADSSLQSARDGEKK